MLAKFDNFAFALLTILLISGCTNSANESAKQMANATTQNASTPVSDVNETASGDTESGKAEIDIEALRAEQRKKFKTTGELETPVRLEADGDPIDIAVQQKKANGSIIAHAGPTIADVDGDGDGDLVVGDFPGHFWLFENETNDDNPRYVSKGKLQAGKEAAKTPVY